MEPGRGPVAGTAPKHFSEMVRVKEHITASPKYRPASDLLSAH